MKNSEQAISDEHSERLKQIRERSESRQRVAGKFEWAQVTVQEWSDIDFLLSLLDSQSVHYQLFDPCAENEHRLSALAKQVTELQHRVSAVRERVDNVMERSRASVAPQGDVVRENLKAIVIRCTDGDPSYDWRPIIARLAQEALNAAAPQGDARACYSELIHIAAELVRGDGFLSTCAEDLNPRLKRADILKTAERQEERLKDWAWRVRQVANKLSAAASVTSPVSTGERVTEGAVTCVLCGHAGNVTANGWCAVRLEKSAEHFFTPYCGCKCEFPAATSTTPPKARYETAHAARYKMTHEVHPDIVVLFFLALKSHWFDDPRNMFYGMREQAKAYLYKWVETGDLADDNTTLEIATAQKFREWLESSWATSTTPDGEQDEHETFAAKHFAFGPCFHSMVQPDCPSCCQSHAVRLEMQLGKLEHSTALPIRERIERGLREHMRHCFQVYKGVPPTVDDWVGGALHYVMWGIEQDLPLTAASPPPAVTPTYETMLTTEWDAANARRHDLITKKTGEPLTEDEANELRELQWLAGLKRELLNGPLPPAVTEAGEQEHELERVLSLLISYGAIHTVEGVTYPDGTHAEALKAAERIRDRLRAAPPSTTEAIRAAAEEIAGRYFEETGGKYNAVVRGELEAILSRLFGKEEHPLSLTWGENPNREPGRVHIEWHAPCGCAFHPTPFPHVHPCSDEHKRPDLHKVI